MKCFAIDFPLYGGYTDGGGFREHVQLAEFCRTAWED